MRVIVLSLGLLVSSAAPVAAANPACANMASQAISAGASLVMQSIRLHEVCEKNGWNSGPCAAQAAVVAQAVVWLWWTSSQWVCGCYSTPPAAYCAAIGLLPAPVAPPAVGGVVPPGPPPPPNPGKEPEPAPEPSAMEVE